MKLKPNQKLNAIVYKIPNADIVLVSDSMNMTVEDYLKRCPKKAQAIYNEHFIFLKNVMINNYQLSMYKCNYGSILIFN